MPVAVDVFNDLYRGKVAILGLHTRHILQIIFEKYPELGLFILVELVTKRTHLLHYVFDVGDRNSSCHYLTVPVAIKYLMKRKKCDIIKTGNNVNRL